MPGLTFSIESAEAVPFAAAPTIAFGLRVENPDSKRAIQSIALRSQILIEASRRHYDSSQREGLHDLFGEPERWSQTLRSLLWTHVSTTVPGFAGSVSTQLLVPCTFDFNVGAAKYFYAVRDESVPLCFQFSGTIFYSSPEGALQIDQISWDKESRFRLPAKAWHEMMDHYYPNSAWLRLRRDAVEHLGEYKRRHGLVTWEEAIENLLATEKEAVS
ncbi:MAG: DUF6084 family protein [Bryobacteraceae bacterium]